MLDLRKVKKLCNVLFYKCSHSIIILDTSNVVKSIQIDKFITLQKGLKTLNQSNIDNSKKI